MPSVGILCIDDSPWVIGIRVGDAVYRLERTLSVGYTFTRSCGGWINHLFTLHNLRGPFKGGRHSTSCDSTELAGVTQTLLTLLLLRPFLIMHVRFTETETRINSRLRSRRNPNMDPYYYKTEIQCLPSNHNHPNVSQIYYFYGTNTNDTTVDYKK